MYTNFQSKQNQLNSSKHNQFKSYSSIKNVLVKPKKPVITDMNAFPELLSKSASEIIPENNSSVPTDATSLVNKIKWIEDEKENDEETWFENLGLTLLVPGDKNVKPRVAHVPPSKTPAEIMKVLADKYEKWKDEYIRDYGIDDYEEKYRFPGYDYEYFDKLDEAWDLELQAEQDLEDEKEKEQNDEYDYDELYTSKKYN